MKLVWFSVLFSTVLGSAIQGQEKCTWGPSYWCSHVAHARECGATKHCLQTVWKYQVIKPESTASCTYCELIVTALKNALADKVTEEKIASVLANACAALPDTDIRDMCKGIVTEYVPELIQMFDQDVSTDMICATVGFCSGLGDKWSPYDVTVGKNDTYCADCMKFFKDVQDSITSKETLYELQELLNQTLCNRLGGFGEICNDFLKQYLPIALQTLADQIDPDIVCRVFGFCASTDKHVDGIKMKNIFSAPALQGASGFRSSEECDICKDFVVEINKVVENQTFQEKLANEIRDLVCSIMGDYQLQCKHLMDGYAAELIKLLANKLELDPEITCKMVGLCSSDRKKVEVVQLVKNMFKVRKSKMLTGHESSEECDICKDLLNQVDEFLRDKANQDKVKYELKNVVCPNFGGLEAECQQLVEEYLPMLFELLVNELDPSTICESAGLCPVPSLPEVVEVKQSEPSAMVGPGYVKESTLCVVCEQIMKEVDDVLEQNDTINTVEEFVDKICEKLPTGMLATECESFVKEYGQLVVDLLAKNLLNPKTFCTEIKLCNKAAVAVLKQTDGKCQLCILFVTEIEAMVANISTKELLDDLKGVCSILPGNLSATCVKYVTEYGEMIINLLKSKEDPKSLCQLATACNGNRIPYMTKPIPESQPTLKVPSEECKICNTVIVMLKFLLKNNSTKEEVKQALESVCKLLPAVLSSPCDIFVQAYGDKIIDLITSELNATEICTELRLCKPMKKQSSAVSVVMSPYDTLPLVELPKEEKVFKSSTECQLCDEAMQMLLSYIGENATKAEIEKEMETFCDRIPGAFKAQCKDLIENYGDKIVVYILQKLDAHSICVKLGLCDMMSLISAVMSPYDTLPIVEPVSEKKESQSSGNAVECEACEFILNYLDKELQDNKTEENIKALLKELCSKLPDTLTSKCTDFVNNYAQAVINFILMDLSPDEICQKLELCPAGVRKLPELVHIKLLKDVKDTSEVKASPECVVCEFVIKELDDILKDNKSEDAIRTALDKVCSFMPDTIRTECVNFVNTYSQIIIKLLVQEVDPEKICSEIGLCSAQTVPSLRKTLLEKDTNKVKASPECVVCEFVIKELDDMLKNNKSEAEIKAALEKVCSIMPGTIRAECITFVDKYGDIIVALLVKDISPDQICSLLGLCSTQSQWGTFVKVLPEKGKETDEVKCVLCKEIVAKIQQYVKENATKEEVEMYLKKLCDTLPDTVTVQCHEVVDQYVPAILDLIGQNLKPEEICQQVGICNNTKVTHKNEDTTLVYKPHRLVGQNKCTYGPAYWCANKNNAVECNALEHCMRHVWN